MIFPEDYSGFLGNSDTLVLASASGAVSTGHPVATTLPTGTDDPKALPKPSAPAGTLPGGGGPFDMTGIDLSWLKNPGGALASGATSVVSYAGLALLGVALIIVSVYVILTDRGAS